MIWPCPIAPQVVKMGCDVQFRQYASDGFDWEARERLAAWLARHPGPVVASNQATDRIVTLYRGLGFDVKLLDGPRRISRTGDRTPAQELLVTCNLDRCRRVISADAVRDGRRSRL